MAWANIPTLTDWQFEDSLKQLRHNAGTTRVTVNALYSAIMDLVDDAGMMDDTVPMSAQTPTEYTLINGWTFAADSDLQWLYGGSIVVQKATTDRDVWANFYTLGTIESDAVVYWLQNGASVAAHSGYTTGHIDQLIKVIAAGSEVNSRKVTAFARNNASGNADLYDHFEAQATATGGRNPIPLATSPDTNDTGGASTYTDVTITFGATSQDIGDGNGSQPYDVIVDGAGRSTAQVYERLKYVTRRGETATLNGVQGQFYTRASASYTEVKPSPFGTYAGGKIFGARGVWITNVSDPNNRVLIDANNVTRTPPTTISVTVTGVVSGDRVLVARSTGAGSTTINKTQFTLNGTHTAGGSTVVVNEAVGSDINTTGVLRIGDDRYTYTALNRGTKTFTISGTLSATYAGGAGAYVPLIDLQTAATSEVYSHVYVSGYDVVARVRKKGIQPFENTAAVTASGASISAIRTTDTIVT